VSGEQLDLNEKLSEPMLTEQETAYFDQLISLPTLSTNENLLLQEDKKEQQNELPNLPVDIIESLNSIVAVGGQENSSSLSNSNDELSLIQTTPLLDHDQPEFLYNTDMQVVQQPLIETQDEQMLDVSSNLNIAINEAISNEIVLNGKESIISLPNEPVVLLNGQEKDMQQLGESTSDKENSFRCQELCCVLKFNTFNYDELLLQ